MLDTGETEEVQDVVKRAKPGCPDCAERNKQKIKDDSLIRDLHKRLDLAGHQAKHLIDNAALLERHIEEKDRDMAELVKVGEDLTNDLRTKIDVKSESTRRLEARLNDSARELRSCQNDLLIANQRIENLVKAQQYQEEQHNVSIANLENKINVACMEDDTGKVQLSVDLHESFRKIGELQGELTNMVRQSEVVQSEVKRITDAKEHVVNEKELLEQQIVQYQREIQRVNDATSEKERNVVRLTRENLTLELNSSKAEKEMLALRKSVKQLEESQKEVSKVAGTPSETKLIATITKLSGELEKANGELKGKSQEFVTTRRVQS